MDVSAIMSVLGLGVLLELLAFGALRVLFGMASKAAAAVVALLAVLLYVPWAMLTWPGLDVFAIQLVIFLTLAYVLSVVGGVSGRAWHWAPASIVGFFVMVIVFNIVFLGVAENGITGVFSKLLPQPQQGTVVDSRFPGEVSHDFQEKEHLYNAYLEQVRAQQARGWQVRKGWAAKPMAGLPATFLVELRDRDGKLLSDAQISGSFLRTSNSQQDFEFELHNVGGGRYQLDAVMPLPGVWQLVMQIRRGEAIHEVRATTSVDASANASLAGETG